MNVVVDSSGWLEYFADGPNAAAFAPAIEAGETLIVPVIAIYEVFKKLAGQRGEGDALKAVAQMYHGQVIDINSPLALLGARLSLENDLPMADSLMLAAARVHKAELWTQDSDFRGIDGVKFISKKK